MGFTKIIYIVNHKGYLVAAPQQHGISRLLNVRSDSYNMGLKFVSLCVVLAMANVICADNAQQEVARASQTFAAKVYQKLRNEDGNILVCPVSVQTVLALVQAGAKSETSDEIRTALSLPADKEVVRRGFQKLMSTLNNAKNVQMDIANNVYVKTGYNVNPNFKQIATKDFFANIENIDFSRQQEAAQSINDWVEQKTHNKIKDLISPDSLDALTRMVLVNALYFKGTWVNEFDRSNTGDREFFQTATKSVKVPMMSQTAIFRYAENSDLDCKFLEMPYAGNEYAMTIILPNKRDGLAALENRISEALLPQDFRSERVEVVMPLFQVETKIEFNEILQALGMSRSFTPDADFSGLLQTKEQLYISKVVQKNFINVTEEGTEAASATGVELELRSGLPDYEVFHADQPFIYYIQEINSTTIVFIGRVASFKNGMAENNFTPGAIESRNAVGTSTEDSNNSGSTLCFNAVTVLLLVKMLHLIFY